MAESYDAIVIGTGQAGPPLAVRLGKAGRKTAIIERKLIGGTCVNIGCIPTKTLIASARAAHVARRAADFGVVARRTGRGSTWRASRRARTRSSRNRTHGVTKWIRAGAERHADRGSRALRRPAHACGSASACSKRRRSSSMSAAAPTVPRHRRARTTCRIFTNTGMMDIDFLPEHLLIVGGSYIGLEFAQMYRRFGSARDRHRDGARG